MKSKSGKNPLLDTSDGLYGRLEETDALDGKVCQVTRCAEAMDDNVQSPLITRKSKEYKKSKKNKERRNNRNVTRGNSSSLSRKPSNSASSDSDQMGNHDRQDHLFSLHSAVPDEDAVLIEATVYDEKEVNKMKQLKGSKMKQYRKTIDRAFRHGWETFLANVHSVTFT